MKSSIENTEIVKILAPLTNNPNAPNKNTEIQILCAAINEYTGIVKILAPWQMILMHQIKMEKPQFFGQQLMGIQKLS